MAQRGYIKIYRKIRDSWIWPSNRPFTSLEAWLDLLLEAQGKPSTREIQGILFDLKRGELAASIRYLASRWRWSRHRVTYFLRRLEKEKQISRKSYTKVTQKVGHRLGQLTICNYGRYNPEGDTKWDKNRPLTEPRKGQIKEGNEVKSSISVIDKTVLQHITPLGRQGLEALWKLPGWSRNDHKDPEFLVTLGSLYPDVSIHAELVRLGFWMEDKGLRKTTRARISNWFKKAHQIYMEQKSKGY